ncbi:hypothetical protein [Actinocorallia longicatena]|uniref:Uncharacterized protein n=1 Tax=Actinocorallia longicatena TaxID=111803 RepID=A0ABP6QLS3_9ACTN
MLPLAWAAGIAVLMIAVATLAGAWLARRLSGRVGLWLAATAAMLLAAALADMIPAARRDAAALILPFWPVLAALAAGFAGTALLTRRTGRRPGGEHAPGRHKRARRVAGIAVFAGTGAAYAVTTHRALESGAMAFGLTTTSMIAITVQALGAGLAMTILLDLGDRRLFPWLAGACLAPALGILGAIFLPPPPALVPIQLGLASGILLCAALIALFLAAREARPAAVAAAFAAGSAVGLLAALIQVPPAFPAPPPGSAPAVAGLPGSEPLAPPPYGDPARPAAAPPQPKGVTPTPARPAKAPAAYLKELRSGRVSLAKALRAPPAAGLDLGATLRTRYPGARVRSALASLGMTEKARVGDLTAGEIPELLRTLGRPTAATARKPPGHGG